MPTIKDVAREAGVSIATVSYVLNNKSASISESTRRQVWEAVERIGYRPNVTARNLRSNQSRLIGYAWHEVSQDHINSVLDRFTYSLARAAEAAGYHILTFTYPANDPLPVYDELIRTGRVDAFVLSSTTLDDVRIRFLLDCEVPFAAFGRSNSDWMFPYVDTDVHRGVSEAVDYLIGLGHTRIAMVAWPEDSLSGAFRLQGYCDTMARAGLPIPPEYIFRGEHSEQTGRDALHFWWALPPAERPTAVMSVSDLAAIGVMNAAEERGLSLPRDLSIIGFDDAPMSRYLRPALTTLHQPIAEIGQALIDILEDSMSHELGQPAPPHRLLMPPTLIMRASCAPPLR